MGWYTMISPFLARVQKVLTDGVQIDNIFLVWVGDRGSNYHNKLAIIGPPAKRHFTLNAGLVSL